MTSLHTKNLTGSMPRKNQKNWMKKIVMVRLPPPAATCTGARISHPASQPRLVRWWSHACAHAVPRLRFAHAHACEGDCARGFVGMAMGSVGGHAEPRGRKHDAHRRNGCRVTMLTVRLTPPTSTTASLLSGSLTATICPGIAKHVIASVWPVQCASDRAAAITA